MWHVLADPASNDFLRMSEPAYGFVALLDGRRTVADAWQIAGDRLGDAAPTQGEAIQLLGQLYASNLLMAELPPDAEGLLKRYSKRRRREVQSYLTNLLFIRIPLIDPEHFLNRWVGVFGRIFSPVGLVVWLGVLLGGGYFVAGRLGELADRTEGLFSAANLPLLYVAMIITKICHEFGHAFAVKRFGRVTGTGGEVHVMGVMLLVFLPLPYVDASSAWAFRLKRHRIVVGTAGVMVELAIAAIAAIVWEHTGNSTLSAICYNVMFIASISTLLFNGNPLLRYDAYYVLSDLVEIPNLAPRSRQYLQYLVKRYVFGAQRSRNPAHTAGERIWFVFYGIASTLYRVVIFALILLFVTDRLPKQFAIIAVLFAAVAAFMWLCVPLGKFVRYLLTSGELDRTRGRAVAATAVFIVLVAVAIGAIPAPERVRVEGVVEPVELVEVYAPEDGFIDDLRDPCAPVHPASDVVVRLRNPKLEDVIQRLKANLAGLRRRRAIATAPETRDPGEVRVLDGHIAYTERQLERFRRRRASLAVAPPQAGLWLPAQAGGMIGRFFRRGEQIGRVAALKALHIRAVVDQADKRLIDEADERVEIRVSGRPDDHLDGRLLDVFPVGDRALPSAALGYAVGGPIATDPKDAEGTTAAAPVFQVRIRPLAARSGRPRLLPGQRVVVRFELPSKPLAVQWWGALRRLLQRRFRI